LCADPKPAPLQPDAIGGARGYARLAVGRNAEHGELEGRRTAVQAEDDRSVAEDHGGTVTGRSTSSREPPACRRDALRCRIRAVRARRDTPRRARSCCAAFARRASTPRERGGTGSSGSAPPCRTASWSCPPRDNRARGTDRGLGARAESDE